MQIKQINFAQNIKNNINTLQFEHFIKIADHFFSEFFLHDWIIQSFIFEIDSFIIIFDKYFF